MPPPPGDGAAPPCPPPGGFVGATGREVGFVDVAAWVAPVAAGADCGIVSTTGMLAVMGCRSVPETEKEMEREKEVVTIGGSDVGEGGAAEALPAGGLDPDAAGEAAGEDAVVDWADARSEERRRTKSDARGNCMVRMRLPDETEGFLESRKKGRV